MRTHRVGLDGGLVDGTVVAHRTSSPRMRRERGTGAVQAGGDGAGRDAEDLGGLAVVEALTVDEHDRDPLVDGQVGQRATHGLRRR